MDIRVVETITTSGVIGDPMFRVNPSLETISLAYDNSDSTLTVIDSNCNYSLLPWQLGTDMVKKVFLTYNGVNCETGLITETVVMESSSGDSSTQAPGFNNSNEWTYSPADFNLDNSLLTMTNPNDWSTLPYDIREGYTVVKEFLTANGTASVTDSSYTAFRSAPTMTTYSASNVEGNRVYTDGWYTSYVITCKNWNTADPINNGAAKGDIVFYPVNNSYYINLTGSGGSLVQDPNNTAISIPDSVNWKKGPTFTDWQNLMRLYVGNPPAVVDQPIYFIENQHLVTAKLNESILEELKDLCCDCVEPTFGVSNLNDYLRLSQKRLGAWSLFSEERWVEAQKVIDSARKMCYLCLYKHNCLTKPSCC